VLPLPDVLNLFAHKFAGGRRGTLPYGHIVLCFPNRALAWHSANVNLRRADTRGACLAFALVALLSARAGAQTQCQAPPHAAPALAATDGRARLEWIDQHLAREAHRMSWWNYGWALGIGASGLGTLVAVPFVAPENRVDYYTGAVMAGAGVIPFLVAPPNVIHDSRQLHDLLQTFPPKTDDQVCALLSDAESRLVRDARNEHLLSGWWSHAANVAINAAGFLFLGFGYHHWLSGALNGGIGFVIGEAVIFTQPRGSMDALARYQLGDLGP
jgi:hypothetical protein